MNIFDSMLNEIFPNRLKGLVVGMNERSLDKKDYAMGEI